MIDVSVDLRVLSNNKNSIIIEKWNVEIKEKY
jgi:hypothetical protein